MEDVVYLKNGSVIRGPVAVFTTLFVLVHLAGGLRLTLSHSPTETVTVGWFTPGAELDRMHQEVEATGHRSFRGLAAADRNLASKISHAYTTALLDHMRELVQRGARIVAWPEGAATVLAENEHELLGQAQTLARKHGANLLLGYLLLPRDWPEDAAENKSALIDANGDVAWHYLKTHPVPGASHKAGDGILPVLDTEFGRISNAICYDLDFPNLIRQAGRAEADWSFPFSDQENETAQSLVQGLAGSNGHVAFSIGAKLPDKDWGDANWTQVLGELSGRYPQLGLLSVGAEPSRPTGPAMPKAILVHSVPPVSGG